MDNSEIKEFNWIISKSGDRLAVYIPSEFHRDFPQKSIVKISMVKKAVAKSSISKEEMFKILKKSKNIKEVIKNLNEFR